MKSKNLRFAIVNVSGMRCKGCVDSIESTVKPLKGVKYVKANLIQNKVSIKFDPNEVKLKKIKSEIESLGYKIVDGSLSKPKNEIKKNLLQTAAFGLIPHIGCIAFLVGSVLGVTILTQAFRPILLSPYFFQILILLSLTFATISSAFYLRRNGLLSFARIKRKQKYLFSMYGSTIGVNLLLLLVIFPLLANVSSQVPVAIAGGTENNPAPIQLSSLKLSVDIPCSGHAPLVTGDVKALKGVDGVQYSLPNTFTISYDPAQTSVQQILALDVFKSFKATVLS